MASKTGKFLLISALTLSAVLVAVGLGLLPVNLFFAKGAINAAVSEQLGGELMIEGPLRVRFGPRPSLSASEIGLVMAGADESPVLRINRLEISPRLFELLQGNLLLRSVEASAVEVEFCFGEGSLTDPSGASESPDAPVPAVAVDSLRIRGFRPMCADGPEWMGILPERLDLRASAAFNQPVEASLRGETEDGDLQLNFKGGSLTDLLTGRTDYPFDVQLQAFDSELTLKGTFSGTDAPVISGQAELSSGQISDLLPALGLQAPALESVHARADFQTKGDSIYVDHFEARLDGHSLVATGSARDLSRRPQLEMDARVDQLSLSVPPKNDNGAHDKPEEPLDLRAVYDALAGFDALLKLRVGRLVNLPVEVEELALEMQLDGRVLDMRQANLLLAGSEVEAEARLDMREGCARLETAVHVANANLETLIPLFGGLTDLSGTVSRAKIKSDSCGASLRAHLETLFVNMILADLAPGWGGDGLPLRLHSLQSAFGWNEPGSLSLEADLLGEPLAVDLGFGTLSAMLSGGEWPLIVTAHGNESRLEFDGRTALGEDSVDFDGVLDIGVKRLGSLHAWTGIDPKNRLALTAHAIVSRSRGELGLTEIVASLGQSDLAGNLSSAAAGSGGPMTAELSSRYIDLEELGGLFPEGKTKDEKRDERLKELREEMEWLARWSAMPPIEINLQAGRIHGLRFDAINLILNARLGDRHIEGGRLSFEVSDIGIEGRLDADFRTEPWSLSYEVNADNIDVGRLFSTLDLAGGIDARADRAKVVFASEGQSLQQLLHNAQLNARIESVLWSFVLGPEETVYEFDLSLVELDTNPQTPVSLVAGGTLNAIPLKLWTQFPSIPAVFDTKETLPISVVMGMGNDITMLDAAIDRRSPNHIRAEIELSGEIADPAIVEFSKLVSPLDGYSFRAGLAIRENELSLERLDARIGASRVTGSTNIRYQQPKYHYEIDLHSPFFETADLVEWVENWRASRQAVLEVEDESVTIDEEDVGPLLLVSQHINDISEHGSFEINLEIEELTSDGKLLGHTLARGVMQENDLRLDLKVNRPGGALEAAYYETPAPAGQEFGLNIHIDRLEYGGLLRLLDPESEANGVMYLDTSLAAQTPDAEHAVNHLQGHLDLVIFPEDVAAGFLDLWASNLIFALLPQGEDSGKKMNCMVARFEVEDGVMKSKTTFLDSTEIIVRARGEIDLLNRQLDLLIAPQAKREKFLSVSTPIEVTGPFEDFHIGVAAAGFLRTMVRWYYGLIYVPWKWLTGERFPEDGIATCYKAMDWPPPDVPSEVK